ncbi:aconitase subunit 2 [Caballeronia peredens]|nr:aconitase subunit 2 [Caballeronia peredens]
MKTFDAVALVPGHARARGIALAPLSFWGGYDAERGVIVDATHAGHGNSLAARVLVMPRARGSSSSSSVLAEALRNGTGPVGIVLTERDLILSIGAIVANELYASNVPVVMVDETAFAQIAAVAAGVEIEIDARDGARPASVQLSAT